MVRLPKVLVGLPSRGMWPVAFEQSLAGALLGVGELFEIKKAYANWHITDDARNQFAATALHEDADFLFFMDTDMIFPKGCLAFMLRHIMKQQEPCVLGGVYSGRSGDHRWHVYKTVGENQYESQKFDLKEGLKEVDVIGTGCMLIDMEVFRMIPMPWFEYEYVNIDNKKFTYERKSEDFVFCDKLRKHNIKLYADTDILCGHLHSVQIWPTPDGGFEVKTIGGDAY